MEKEAKPDAGPLYLFCIVKQYQYTFCIYRPSHLMRLLVALPSVAPARLRVSMRFRTWLCAILHRYTLLDVDLQEYYLFL